MEASKMAKQIIEECINSICSVHFWEECKDQVRAMFTTACIIGNYEIDTSITDKWLDSIFDCFDDWVDRNAFRVEVENYLIAYLV